MRPPVLRTSPFYRRDCFGRRLFTRKNSPDTKAASKSIASGSESSTSVNDIARKSLQERNRLDRLLNRTPKFLQHHVSALRNAPLSHTAAFLLLHELTAVVPLFGLAGAFHYYNWLPKYFSEGAWVINGVEMFGRYFRRKGWISDGNKQEAEELVESGQAQQVESKTTSRSTELWKTGEGGVRVVVEFATAYAIVKVLLVPRLILSAWCTPWFARWTVVPILNKYKQIFRRSKTAA